MQAHILRSTKERDGRIWINQIGSEFEADEAKAIIRSGDRWVLPYERQSPRWQPLRIALRPTVPEQRQAFDYLREQLYARSSGRRIKTYVVLVQTEDAEVYYCGGIYSTLKAAKDYGPSDIIAVCEHRGGNRNVRFDPPDASQDIWLES